VFIRQLTRLSLRLQSSAGGGIFSLAAAVPLPLSARLPWVQIQPPSRSPMVRSPLLTRRPSSCPDAVSFFNLASAVSALLAPAAPLARPAMAAEHPSSFSAFQRLLPCSDSGPRARIPARPWPVFGFWLTARRLPVLLCPGRRSQSPVDRAPLCLLVVAP
jgi:hypothetical protein